KDLHIYDQSQKTFILNGIVNKVDQLIEWIKVDNTEPEHLLSTLFAHGVNSVVIEGGAKLLNSFYNSGQYHEIRKIVSKNCVLGHGLKGPLIKDELSGLINLEEDILFMY
ncbi:MAG: bifunctional diaminohydroxyphosphoribosylaminopyrimidine, partial [Bacteroidota bacterium]